MGIENPNNTDSENNRLTIAERLYPAIPFTPATGERQRWLERACGRILSKAESDEGIDVISFKKFVRTMIELIGGTERQGWKMTGPIASEEGKVSFWLSYEPNNKYVHLVVGPAWLALPEEKQELVASKEPYFEELVSAGDFGKIAVQRYTVYPKSYTHPVFRSFITGKEIPINTQLDEISDKLDRYPSFNTDIPKLCRAVLNAYQKRYEDQIMAETPR